MRVATVSIFSRRGSSSGYSGAELGLSAALQQRDQRLGHLATARAAAGVDVRAGARPRRARANSSSTAPSSASLSVGKMLIATSAGRPKARTFSTWRSRLGMPARTAATFSRLARSFLSTPPCSLSARAEAMTTAASGVRPVCRATISQNFSKPRSAPKPVSTSAYSPKLERQPGGADGVGAVGDVGEGAAMDQRRAALQGLHQIGVEGVLEQRGQRALRPCRSAARIGSLARVIADHDAAEPRVQIGQIARPGRRRP